MPNLVKLDETIDQLERQAEILKENNLVLAKVSELSTVIAKGVNELSVANKDLDSTKMHIQTSLSSLSDSVRNLENQNEKHIEALIAFSKKNLRELEDTVSSKIARFSSDIQVSIRQERSQLQEALQSNISGQFNNLETKQKDLFVNQEKQLSVLRILLIVVIGLCVGLGIKLFM